MTRRTWPPDFQPEPASWMRCCLCGIAQRVRDMVEVGQGRWVCNEDAGSPLCRRLRGEVGAAQKGAQA
jgi:hypothetical protein